MKTSWLVSGEALEFIRPILISWTKPLRRYLNEIKLFRASWTLRAIVQCLPTSGWCNTLGSTAKVCPTFKEVQSRSRFSFLVLIFLRDFLVKFGINAVLADQGRKRAFFGPYEDYNSARYFLKFLDT